MKVSNIGASKASAAPPWPELDVFVPVRAYASRHECVLLAFEVLGEVLDQALATVGDGG